MLSPPKRAQSVQQGTMESAPSSDSVDVTVTLEEPLLRDSCDEEEAFARTFNHSKRSTWAQTTTALLSLQLGWGLWLFPSGFARLGWIPSLGGSSSCNGVVFAAQGPCWAHLPAARCYSCFCIQLIGYSCGIGSLASMCD